MDLLSESGSCGGFSASLPDDFAGDRHFPGVPAISREQPEFRCLSESAAVTLQFLQEFRAEHDIAVLAALSALDVNDHSFPVDIAHLQMCQFGTPQSGGVQSHQQDTVKHCRSSIDEPRYLFRAEDLRKTESLARVGCFSNRPWSPQRRHEEESKRRGSLGDCVGSQFALTEQIRLILAKLVWAKLIRWAFEIARQVFERFDVGAYGTLRVIRRSSSSSIILLKWVTGTSL
jgi:hypothetical protein